MTSLRRVRLVFRTYWGRLAAPEIGQRQYAVELPRKSVKRKGLGAPLIVLLGLLVLSVACGPAQPASTASSIETVSPPLEEATEPAASVAGRYRLRPPNYYEGTNASPASQDYYLTLNEDGTAQFEEETIDTGEVAILALGTWKLDGNGAIIEVTELSGEALASPQVIRYEYRDGFPVATEYEAEGELYNLEQAEFTIGAGERHPLVRELHRRLASIDYLGFTDPNDDLFTEETRKAVVAFQEAQGLYPNGEVNPATWVLLANPQPPLPTPTPAPSPPAGAVPGGVPDLQNLPTHSPDGKPIVYLTFDDGPSSYTQQMLDAMAKYDAESTFFVLGKQAEAKPDLIRGEAQDGHYVANHTYSHESLQGMSQETFIDEVEKTRQIILDIALDLFSLDKDVRYLRPPYGATDANTRQYAGDLGYAVVLWDIDPQDWRRPGAKVIADHIISSVYPGAIVLMHDGGGDRVQSVTALETVLRELSNQGYVFRNVFAP
jgi:peptidoglycan/xylan/chitin deacetylase (PgdA/CDA1 family)